MDECDILSDESGGVKMKVIILQAFGGLLKSDYIVVQDWPKDYRVPYNKFDGLNYAVDVTKIDATPTFRTARFIPTQKFVVLPNNNTALIYELEQM